MTRRRVVVTGMGVVAPNGVGLAAFDAALREGKSGLRHVPKLAGLGFGCTVAGVPEGADAAAEAAFDDELLLAMNANHRYGALAAVEAWTDAGFTRPEPGDDRVHWEAGAVLGTGVGGLDTVGEKLVPLTDAGKVRRLGSTMVEQVMGSGVSARVSGLLALGNQVTSNSSACSTGTEAVLEGVARIRAGLAERMLCGGSEGDSHYVWAGFDGMRVLSRRFNDEPERASRPMSASAGGFVPAAGAGVLHLESLESAEKRGARIHAEVLGGALNCGGHRGGGSMTAPNPESVRRCIRAALADASLDPREVDAISGHLTATGADPAEVGAWADALERVPAELPPITSTKSMIGHALGAAGAVESVACIQMLRGGYVHPSLNCEDVHPRIAPFS
ncbi:MAG TPA: beta-ketoacyl-[acyl-carrier-protein] synthase family protein, partial [Vicinamibacteria bacterium]|nr:beta-ketoacyl-[acyl-carrier-protein] synthase family protein [Vicinamibacteria bacterium]